MFKYCSSSAFATFLGIHFNILPFPRSGGYLLIAVSRQREYINKRDIGLHGFYRRFYEHFSNQLTVFLT